MVMFKEDEERIKKMERAEKEAKRGPIWRWTRRLIKFSLIAAVLLFIGLTLLMRMAENSEHLQAGILDFMEKASGMEVEVASFEKMRVFPVVSIQLEDITFTKPDAESPSMKAEEFEYASGFWSLMFSRDVMRALSVKNAFIGKDVTGRRDLTIQTMQVTPDAMGEGKPGLLLEGKWGTETLRATMAMDVKKDGESIKSYSVADDSDFTLKLGKIEMSGKKTTGVFTGLSIDIDKLTDQKASASGTLEYHNRWGTHNIGFDLTANSSRLKGDAQITPELIEGKIDVPSMHMEDVADTIDLVSSIADLLADQQEGPAEISLPEGDVAVDFKVKDLYGNGTKLGKLDIAVRISGDKLTIKKLGGTFSGGKVSGDIVLDTSVSPTSFSIKGALKDWDYGVFQEAYLDRKNMSGTADVHLSLDAVGNTVSAIKNNLHGEIVMIAGEGQFESAALNIWGAGLVRALIPNIGDNDLTKLNCMIADFEVENGIAAAKPFFIDTQRLKLVGDGTINLAEQSIDMVIEPKAKGAAFLDVATAVKINGPLANPEIGPSTFSLLEKIGGLALGAINPAFLVFSMTDLGLTDNHPCSKFIEESKQGAEQVVKDEQETAEVSEEPELQSTANEGVNE